MIVNSANVMVEFGKSHFTISSELPTPEKIPHNSMKFCISELFVDNWVSKL